MAHPLLQKSRRGGLEVPVLEISSHRLPRGHPSGGGALTLRLACAYFRLQDLQALAGQSTVKLNAE